MPDQNSDSIRHALSARPRRGQVDLRAIDPSETNGIKRFQVDERLLADDWNFSRNDISERRFWDDYQKAYATALGRCSTAAAPWFVVPANRKWYRNWAVAQLLIETMEGMKLTYPNPNLDVRALKKSLQAVA